MHLSQGCDETQVPLVLGDGENVATPNRFLTHWFLRRRDSSRTSRKLALLRAHGLIKKIPHTHRYELTTGGRTIVTAWLAARNATPKLLAAA